MVNQPLLQVRLQQPPRLRQAEKFQQHRVAHKLARRRRQLRDFLLRLRLYRLAVLAGKQPLIIEPPDLPFERARTPVLRHRLVDIPLACLLIFKAQQRAVMRPAQFGTQCVPNWEREEKGTHVPQIPLIETLPKILGQSRRQPRQ